MYLKTISLQHTGPIDRLTIEMPFRGECPKPVVLVGPNGSGKSTVLSFIVNALITFKQHAFDDTEIEKGRVYRIRSPLGIHSGENFYHSHLTFEHDLQLQEWQLDRSRETFEKDLGWTPIESSWNNIPSHENTHFAATLGTLTEAHKMEEAFSSNCILFFPADRFEPPDWLNTEDLSHELKLPEPTRMKGRSPRRIFSRNRLKPTMEWLTAVLLDMLLLEHREVDLLLQGQAFNPPAQVAARIPAPGPTTAVFNAIVTILRHIIAEQPEDQIKLEIGGRRSRIVSAHVFRNGARLKTIRDLLSLSAGESALFCLFAAIILDADQAGMSFKSPEDIRGLVLIDEADLHLHLGLQHNVLPRLLALFPRVQFVMTLHSPLVILGMEAAFGSDFSVLEMPSGNKINPESYTEFLNAFDVLSRTRKFQASLLAQAIAQTKPVLLLEGKTDAELIRIAWSKIYPNVDIPFTPIGCGAATGSGGAKTLNSALRYLTGVFDKKVVAVFDNDREGAPQFGGLKQPDFITGVDSDHKRHASKDVHAVLLPVPTGRADFVPVSVVHRVLEIEHYFDDALLTSNAMKGNGIYPGTPVFEIAGDKTAFAQRAAGFAANEFNGFITLFTRIQSII